MVTTCHGSGEVLLCQIGMLGPSSRAMHGQWHHKNKSRTDARMPDADPKTYTARKTMDLTVHAAARLPTFRAFLRQDFFAEMVRDLAAWPADVASHMLKL